MDYICTFINKSRGPFSITERGLKLFDVPAEGESRLEMFKPSVSWARWSKVVIGADREIETLVENTAWAAPWKKEDDLYLIEFYNEHGSAGGENIRLLDPNPVLRRGTPFLLIPKGVPTIVPLRIEDQLIKYCRVHWKLAEKKLPVGDSGYHKRHVEVISEKTLRPQAELVQIFTRRAALNAAAFEKEQKKHLTAVLGLAPEVVEDGKS